MRAKIIPLLCLLAGSLMADDKAPDIIGITPGQLSERGIELKKVQGGSLQVSVVRRGKIILHPDHVAYVLPQVPGVVLEARKNIGDEVGAGEVLALLQSKDLADIQAQYLLNLNKENVTTALYERENSLHDKGLTSEEDFLNAQSAWQEAKLNRQILQQKLKALGMTEGDINNLPSEAMATLGIYMLRAPLAGQVLERNLSKGQYLESNVTTYTIADLDTLWVEIGIYPKDAAAVKPGQRIEITRVGNEKSVDARMITIHPVIEEDTILSKVIAELDNKSRIWLPGSYVNARLIVDNPQVAIAVPKDAVQTIDDQECVFVLTPKGFEKRVIKTGRCDEDQIEVLSGLKEGEMIPSQNTFLFKAEYGKNSIEPDDDQ